MRQPKALLLDEPLSNLDAKLRDDMRVELKTLTERLNITTLFVTHDQLEALTLSDKIAVMRDGEIVQLGGPKDIYDDPNSRFTAEFIGTTNLLEGTVASRDGNVMRVETPQGTINCAAVELVEPGDSAAIAIRPANIGVSAERREADNVIEGEVETVVFLGDSHDCRVDVGGAVIRAFVHASQPIARGDRVFLSMSANDCRVLPAEAAFVEAEDGGGPSVGVSAAAPPVA